VLPKTLSPPRWEDKHLRLAIDAAGVALWSWNVDNDKLTMDEHGYAMWGVPLAPFVTFEDLSCHIHPADRDRVRAAFAATRGITGPYEIDFRIMLGNDVRWVSARGQGDDVGIVGSVMYGIFIDVTGRKQAEEGNELLAGEMSHRVKNLLAIAAGLTAITSRSSATATDMARQLTQRLTALGRAHDLVRPIPGHEARYRAMRERQRCWAICLPSCSHLMTTWEPSADVFESQCRGWAWAKRRLIRWL
jgi:HWE histidine kinase/PAS fold